MVPTTVERLREGQGVLERVLRSIKMERNYKRSDGSTEKESGMKNPQGSLQNTTLYQKQEETIDGSKQTAISYASASYMGTCLSVMELILFSVFTDADRYEMQASVASPMKSPHRYSPSMYSHQVAHRNQHHDYLFVTGVLVNKLPVAF